MVSETNAGNHAMKKTANGYLLSSGREIQAREGLVSITYNDDGTLSVFEGYDSSLNVRYGDEEEHECWTLEERRELADYMIALWIAFKAGKRHRNERERQELFRRNYG
jgi:hypothetical protein